MGKNRYMLVTVAPLLCLLTVILTASYQKIWSQNPRVGFLAHARQLATQSTSTPTAAHELSQLRFNDCLDAALTGILVLLVLVIVGQAISQWSRILSGRKVVQLTETPFVMSRSSAEQQT
jgi:carbon starvation protein